MGILSRLKHMVLERVTTPRAFNLLPSLSAATLTRVRWEGRYSRSGNTFYVRKIQAELKTGKHEHELDCWYAGGILFCSWKVDGEEMGVLELSYEDPLYRKIMDAIGFGLRAEKIGENEVRLYERPLIEPEPETAWKLRPEISWP